MLKRIFTYITLLSYLVVGTVAIRVCTSEMQTVELTREYFALFSNTEEVSSSHQPKIYSPVMKFAKINFPSERKVVAVKKAVAKTAAPFLAAPKLKGAFKLLPPPKLKSVTSTVSIEFKNPTKNELPFNEPVKLSPVAMKTELETNLVSLYKEFTYEMVADVAPVLDTVSTKASAANVADVNPEPEFFEYPEVKEAKEEKKPVQEKAVEVAEAPAPVVEEEIIPQAIVEEKVVTKNIVQEEDLVAFDYSKAKIDVTEQVIPKVTEVTTQVVHGVAAPVAKPVTTQVQVPNKTAPPAVTTQTRTPARVPAKPEPQGRRVAEPIQNEEVNALMSSPQMRLNIQVEGTDLSTSQAETGFEIRFSDDNSEAIQDYNSGSVVLEVTPSTSKMTRSAVILKRGFAPTNTDLILEQDIQEVSIPLIEEGKFNEILAPYESRGPIGAVLVELEKGVETATLDVPYSQVLKLDEDMTITEETDAPYQLFVGVKAGNALLSYRESNGEVTSKIIHIHERELTFDANLFEDVLDEKIVLKEEDLLSEEKAPLIISSEQIRHFATEKLVSKINDHTYKTSFNKTLLGARKYVELGHQEESIFVGYKTASTLDIPSEDLIRYVLSQFQDKRLGNRCLVQVNLTKRAVDVKVGSESAGESLMTYTQVLDSNGKFFDSLSAKSKKLLIVGENQGSEEYSKDGKINIKITFEDGSVQYLGSYCSPNTYLVEQL